jgi:hypothetical protein
MRLNNKPSSVLIRLNRTYPRYAFTWSRSS